jgi:hypothetical protein
MGNSADTNAEIWHSEEMVQHWVKGSHAQERSLRILTVADASASGASRAKVYAWCTGHGELRLPGPARITEPGSWRLGRAKDGLLSRHRTG